MPGSTEKEMFSMSWRSSIGSKLSMCGPFACTSVPVGALEVFCRIGPYITHPCSGFAAPVSISKKTQARPTCLQQNVMSRYHEHVPCFVRTAVGGGTYY